MDHVYAVIMAGGVGSRFWPASRAASPKQLLDLTNSGRTMIAATVDRLRPIIPPERVLVVTGAITWQAVVDALPEVPRENILAEPSGRNTAPCIGWAALHVRRRDPRGILAVLPADHLIADQPRFAAALQTALEAAAGGAIVTMGIVPDRPETGFGYIELGSAISPGVRGVVRFVEKPDLATAEGYLRSGNFAWNSGMFFFSQQRILAELSNQLPALMQGLETIDQALAAGREAEAVNAVYPTLPSISIDYGVMERTRDILCVPVDFGWSDLGSWAAAYDLSRKDGAGNAVGARAIAVGATGCLVRAPAGKLVALVGVEDLVVVDTGDALLICSRERSQEVKDVVNALQKGGARELL